MEVSDADEEDDSDYELESSRRPVPRIKLVLGNRTSKDIKGKGKPPLRESSEEDTVKKEVMAPRGINWLRQELAGKSKESSGLNEKSLIQWFFQIVTVITVIVLIMG